MTTIEKIKAELERLKNDWASLDDDLTDTMVAEYDYLLDFLSILEESEKPMNQEDLEKEIDRYFFPLHPVDIQEEPFTQMDKCARHFAQWGAEHAKGSSEIPKDLEEAAMNYIAPIENEDGLKVINFSGQDIKDAFIAGAKWQAEHQPLPEDTVIYQKGVEEGKRLMIEEAVEGEVVKDISNKLAVTAKINLDGFKFGDKVRVIVIPNTDEK